MTMQPAFEPSGPLRSNTLPAPGARAQQRAPRIEVAWARHLDDVRAAQRLRWRVFAEEMGARLSPPPGAPAGHDADRFDDACEHLLVRTVHDAAPSRVIGTYRVLTPDGARRAGGLYTDGEFELGRLDESRPRIAELGRSCVDPDWRTGGVILMLWTSLLQFMQDNRLGLMIGCASVPMRDGGRFAASLWRQFAGSVLPPAERRVQPRTALPVNELESDLVVEPPPLIKGYLSLGAQVLGAPAWDPDFNTADFPMMLDLDDMPPRYRKRLLGR